MHKRLSDGEYEYPKYRTHCAGIVRGRSRSEFIPEVPPTTEDVLMLVLRSKSMQGVCDAIGNPEYPGLRGLSSNTYLQIFLIGWYARDTVRPEILSELEALIRELRPPLPETEQSVGSAQMRTAHQST